MTKVDSGPADLARLVDRLVRRFTGVDDIERLAEVAFELVCEFVAVEYSGVYLVDPGEGRLRLFCCKGFSEEERAEAQRTALERHPGHVLRTGEILHIPDVDADPSGRSVESARSFHIRSRLYIPVVVEEEVVGALGLGSPNPGAFSEFDISVLSFVAGIAGVAWARIDASASVEMVADARSELEEQLSVITSAARDAIVLVDDRGLVTFWNGAARDLFGYEPEEVLGRELHLLLAPKDTHAAYRDGMAAFRDSGKGPVVGRILEFVATARSGEQIPVELSVAATRLGGRWHAVGIARDIRERIRLQQERQRDLERFRRLADCLPGAVVELNASGRVTYANGEAGSLFGGGSNRLPEPPSFLDGIAPEDWNRASEDFAMVLRGMRIDSAEYTALRLGGERFAAAISATPVPGVQGDDRALVVIRDVSPHRSQQDELLLARRQLERRVEERTEEIRAATVRLAREVDERRLAERRLLDNQRSLRRLAAALSGAEERERHRVAVALHDRVGQALSLCQLRLVRLAGVLDGARRQKVDEALAGVEEAITEVRDVTFELSPPILYELGLVPALEWLAELTEERYGLRCRVRAAGSPLVLSESLRALVFRVLGELLFNVVKHAAATAAAMRIAVHDGTLTACVEDDGVGFTRGADQSDVAPREGFGLFSIRERLRLLGGDLQIRSSLGGGAAVTVILPIPDPPREE